MSKRQGIPEIPTPEPSKPMKGVVGVVYEYDGTCDSCGRPATQYGWVMTSAYEKEAPSADILIERTGWCEEMSCQRSRARSQHVLDREAAWGGHTQ